MPEKANEPEWETPDLYKVYGLAPTYTNPRLGGKFANVTMNWWVWRQRFFFFDYNKIFGGEEYGWPQVLAVSQMFLLREAQMFKEWIDGLYPEENTTIVKVEYPFPNDITPYPIEWKDNCGSLQSKPYNYHYDLDIWYFIDVTNCKVIEPAKEGDSIDCEYKFPKAVSV
jgi:hypothetical protein